MNSKNVYDFLKEVNTKVKIRGKENFNPKYHKSIEDSIEFELSKMEKNLSNKKFSNIKNYVPTIGTKGTKIILRCISENGESFRIYLGEENKIILDAGVGFYVSIPEMFTSEERELIEKEYKENFKKKFEERTQSTHFDISDSGEKIISELQKELKMTHEFFKILRSITLQPCNFDFTNDVN